MGLHFVNLEGTGAYHLDLGVGVGIGIQNLNFSQEGAKTTVQFDYQKSTQNAEDFNYENFQKGLKEATDQVDSQIKIVKETLAKFQEDEQKKQQLLRGNASSSNNALLGASSAVSLLSSQVNSGVAKLFSSKSSLLVNKNTSSKIFLTTHSMIKAQSELKFSSVKALSKK